MSEEAVFFGVYVPGEESAPCSAQPKSPPSRVEEISVRGVTSEVKMNDISPPNPGTSTQPKAPPPAPAPPPPPPRPSK